jgi:hypothetical protein
MVEGRSVSPQRSNGCNLKLSSRETKTQTRLLISSTSVDSFQPRRERYTAHLTASSTAPLVERARYVPKPLRSTDVSSHTRPPQLPLDP